MYTDVVVIICQIQIQAIWPRFEHVSHDSYILCSCTHHGFLGSTSVIVGSPSGTARGKYCTPIFPESCTRSFAFDHHRLQVPYLSLRRCLSSAIKRRLCSAFHCLLTSLHPKRTSGKHKQQYRTSALINSQALAIRTA